MKRTTAPVCRETLVQPGPPRALSQAFNAQSAIKPFRDLSNVRLAMTLSRPGHSSLRAVARFHRVAPRREPA